MSSSPLIWFLLLDSATGQPYKGTTVSSVLRSSLVVPVIDQFRDAVKKKDKDDGDAAILTPFKSSQLLVYRNKAAFDKRNAQDGNKEEPLEEDSLIDDLGNTKKEALIVVVPSTYQGTIPMEIDATAATSAAPSFQQILSLVATTINATRTNGTMTRTTYLIETSGGDFTYLDRDGSFKILAESLNDRIKNREKRDRNLFPIPFLAGGPGVGKSRFLQELPCQFLEYVSTLPGQFSDVKELLNDASFINISFGNATAFDETHETDIQKAVGFRILYQYLRLQSYYGSFGKFCQTYNNETFSLDEVFSLFDTRCIVLGVDEINRVHDRTKSLFRNLFYDLGTLMCGMKSHILVPVFAGTVIGPIKEVVTKSGHPPLPIPLPLLTFDSSLTILRQKNPKYQTLNDERFKVLIWEVGGHCRALEILYDALERVSEGPNPLSPSYWEDVFRVVRDALLLRYAITSVPLGMAIAYSFLSRIINPTDTYPEDKSLTFRMLQEKGLIMLDQDRVLKVPFIFTHIFLTENIKTSKAPVVAQFWMEAIFAHTFYWQAWEDFNQHYFAFRMSLYAYLGEKTVSLKEFFQGALLEIAVDKTIAVPDTSDIKLLVAPHQYPTNDDTSYSVGQVVKNVDGAPFDAFMYVNVLQDAKSKTTEKLLLAMQLKLSRLASKNRTGVTKHLVDQEYQKMNKSIADHLKGTDFVCVMLCCTQSDVTEQQLPGKCVFVSRTQHVKFYGDHLARRLEQVS